MVWQAPEDVEQSRQDQRRAAFLWAVFALLVAAALAAQAFVPRALQVELGPREENGQLSVQMPAGWAVTRQGQSMLIADSGSERRGQALTVSLVPADERVSLLEVTAAGFGEDVGESDIEDVARRVKIDGRVALLISQPGLLTTAGRSVEVQVVRLAFQPAAGTVAIVQMIVRGGWNKAAEVVVQQVARTIRIADQE